MLIVYIYDIKAKSKSEKEFNRVKRRFYYALSSLSLSKAAKLTKSALVVFEKDEVKMDALFRQFDKDIIVYKIYASSVELL